MRLGKITILSLMVLLMFSACVRGKSKESTSSSTDTDTTIPNTETNITDTNTTIPNIETNTTDTNTTQPPLVIDGYTLPPMPDKVLNDSTLLGIDSNDNGVRDDVEIWIYTTYAKPIERAVFMQSSRAYQIVIQEPEKALENLHYMHDASNCRSYWRLSAKENGESSWLEKYRDYPNEIHPIQFNTKERFLAYEKYNHTLSGGVYTSAKLSEWKSRCDFNTSSL